jgi:hypothetical protein
VIHFDGSQYKEELMATVCTGIDATKFEPKPFGKSHMNAAKISGHNRDDELVKKAIKSLQDQGYNKEITTESGVDYLVKIEINNPNPTLWYALTAHEIDHLIQLSKFKVFPGCEEDMSSYFELTAWMRQRSKLLLNGYLMEIFLDIAPLSSDESPSLDDESSWRNFCKAAYQNIRNILHRCSYSDSETNKIFIDCDPTQTITLAPYSAGIINAIWLLQSGLSTDEILETFHRPHDLITITKIQTAVEFLQGL